MKVILDTNFLIYCTKEKIDYVEKLNEMLHEKFDIVVPLIVIDELKKIMKKQKRFIPFVQRKARYKKTTGRDKEAAALALAILNKHIIDGVVKTIDISGKTVDEALIALAQEDKKNIVCTLDKEMRSILGRVILMNKNKQLILTR